MAIAPFFINQTGNNKQGRDLLDNLFNINSRFALVKQQRDSMIQDKNRAGTLSTRTNNTDGTLTLDAGHGIATGDIIDLEFSGGTRVNVVVGTVNGLLVPISGGTGNNLPAADAAVTAIAWRNMAEVFQFLASLGGSVSAVTAKAAFLELDSMIANIAGALEQCCARYKQ